MIVACYLVSCGDLHVCFRAFLLCDGGLSKHFLIVLPCFVGHVWSDKSPVEFTNWNPQQPDSHQGQQPCVEMYSTGDWADTGCYSVKQFICKMPRCKFNTHACGFGPIWCIHFPVYLLRTVLVVNVFSPNQL